MTWVGPWVGPWVGRGSIRKSSGLSDICYLVWWCLCYSSNESAHWEGEGFNRAIMDIPSTSVQSEFYLGSHSDNPMSTCKSLVTAAQLNWHGCRASRTVITKSICGHGPFKRHLHLLQPPSHSATQDQKASCPQIVLHSVRAWWFLTFLPSCIACSCRSQVIFPCRLLFVSVTALIFFFRGMNCASFIYLHF